MNIETDLIGTDIRRAAALICRGELVGIPTETVYGLGANALQETAIRKIFAAKNRPATNPLILHLADAGQISDYATDIPDEAYKLLAKFSPGPLTIVLPKKKGVVPDIVTAKQDTVAIRIPAHPIAQKLLQTARVPIAAPSANRSGYISPTTAQHVVKTLAGRVSYVLDGGHCAAGIESTIVGFRNGKATIYREGVISKTDLLSVVGRAEYYLGRKTFSPGMSASHYSPDTPFMLSANIEADARQFAYQRIGIITYNRLVAAIPRNRQILLCTDDRYDQAAKNLYAAMHEMDERGYDLIIAKKFPEVGIGVALNDRLRRAALKA